MGWLSVWLLTQKSNLHLHRKSCPVRKHLLVILQRSRSCKSLFSCAFAFPSSFPYRPLYSQAGIRISSDTSSPVAIFFLCLHNFIGYYFIFVHSTHDDRGLEWRRMALFLNFWKIQNILLNIRQVFSVGPRRWFKGCRPLANTGICLAVGFLDKIGAGVRKADFRVKGLALRWKFQCNRRGHHRSEDAPPPVPAQSSTESGTASSLTENGRVQNWDSSLPAAEVGPICKTRGYAAVSQAYCTEQSHISWVMLQLRWLGDTTNTGNVGP